MFRSWALEYAEIGSLWKSLYYYHGGSKNPRIVKWGTHRFHSKTVWQSISFSNESTERLKGLTLRLFLPPLLLLTTKMQFGWVFNKFVLAVLGGPQKISALDVLEVLCHLQEHICLSYDLTRLIFGKFGSHWMSLRWASAFSSSRIRSMVVSMFCGCWEKVY